MKGMMQNHKTTPLRGKAPLRHTINEISKWCNLDTMTGRDGSMEFLVYEVKDKKEVKSRLLDYLFYVNGYDLEEEVQENKEYICYTVYSEYLEWEDYLYEEKKDVVR